MSYPTFRNHPQREQSERHISIDDWLYEGEMDQIARERLKLNGNGNAHAERYCECAETLLHGKRVPSPPQHDCFYCRSRSGLVDQAAKNASRRVTVGYNDRIGEAAEQWTKVFASEMDRLCDQLGI